MDELVLEPYAARQYWKFLPGQWIDWPALVGEYLEVIATRCMQSAPCVIGHLKALSTFQGGEYLQVSVVAPSIPATITGKTPPGLTELELTLNVIVYGLERRQLEKIVGQAVSEIAQRWKGEVYGKDMSHRPDYPTNENHTHA